MAVPTQHLSNLPRDQEVQEMIKAFVKFNLPAQAMDMLAHILETTPDQIGFTYNEGLKIASRPDISFVQGQGTQSGLNSVGFPLLQMYDFIFTVDRVIDQIKGLRRQVTNLGALRSSANLEILKQQILSNDYMPWQLRDSESVAELLKSTDQAAKNRTIGMRLASPFLYHEKEMDGYSHVPLVSTARIVAEMFMDSRRSLLGNDEDKQKKALVSLSSAVNQGPENGSVGDVTKLVFNEAGVIQKQHQGGEMKHSELVRRLKQYADEVGSVDGRQLRKKNSYEQSVDEAALLGFDTLNAIVALSQGLFQVELTNANKLQASTVRDLANSARDSPSSVIRPDDYWKMLAVSTTDGERVSRLTASASESQPLKLHVGELRENALEMSDAGKALAQSMQGPYNEAAAVSDIPIPRKSWVNAFANTAVGLNGGVALLQPKVTDVSKYPANWLGRVYVREVKDQDRARKHFGYRGVVEPHRLPALGGAIARSFFAVPVRFALEGREKVVIRAFSAGSTRSTGFFAGIMRTFGGDPHTVVDGGRASINERGLTPLEAYPKQWDDGLNTVLDTDGRKHVLGQLNEVGFEHTVMQLRRDGNDNELDVTYGNVGVRYLDEATGVSQTDKYGKEIANKTLDTIGFVTSGGNANSANPDMTDIDLSDPATPPTRATRVSMKQIFGEMQKLSGHPITACPGLSAAFQDAKLHTYLLSLYSELQREFSSALARADIDVHTTDARQLGRARGRGRGLGSAVKCGPNQVPVFRDSENRVLPWEEAVFTHPETGQEFLNPRVSMANSSCTDLIPAPSGIPKIAQLPTVARIRRLMQVAEGNAGRAAAPMSSADMNMDTAQIA